MRREIHVARVRSPALREAFGALSTARGGSAIPLVIMPDPAVTALLQGIVVLTITSVAVEELTVYDEPMTLAELRGPGWPPQPQGRQRTATISRAAPEGIVRLRAASRATYTPLHPRACGTRTVT